MEVKLAFLVVLYFLSGIARADVLYINLNDAPLEIEACQRGIDRADNEKPDLPDGSRPRPNRVVVVNPSEPGEDITVDTINEALSERETKAKKQFGEEGVKQGETNRCVTSIDSIFISGEDGTGRHFEKK